MANARKKQLRLYIQTAKAQGWEVTLRRGGHYRLLAPDDETMVFCPSTPSDHRSLKNLRSQLRRSGVKGL